MVKISFNLLDNEYEDLKAYVKRTNISVTDVLCHGIQLVLFVAREETKNKFMLEDRSTGELKEVVFPWR